MSFKQNQLKVVFLDAFEIVLNEIDVLLFEFLRDTWHKIGAREI